MTSPRDDRFEWITVKEFAKYRRVSERTVREWIREKKVEAERTAGDTGHWRIKVPRAS